MHLRQRCVCLSVCVCGFPSHLLLLLWLNLQLDISQLMMTSVNGSQSLSPIHRPTESPGGGGGSSGVGGPSGAAVEQSPVDRTKGFFPDESEPLLRCDSTSSKDSALSRNGSFITKGKESMKLMCTAANKHRWQITDVCSRSGPPQAPFLSSLSFYWQSFFYYFSIRAPPPHTKI